MKAPSVAILRDGADAPPQDEVGGCGKACREVYPLMVRRRASAVSNHEGPVAILRDAATRLLRMRSVGVERLARELF
jgi:hypothetical protein